MFVKIMLLSLVLLFVLIFAVYWLISSAMSEHTNRLAGVQVRRLALEALDKLDRNLFERYSDIQPYAQSAAAKSMDRTQIENWMQAMLFTHRPIYRLMVVAGKQDNKIIASFGVDNDSMDTTSKWIKRDTFVLRGLDVAAQQWFQELTNPDFAAGTAIVSDAARDSIMQLVYGTNNVVMTYSYPIQNWAGQVVGVWHHFFNWQVAKKSLRGACRLWSKATKYKGMS
ncbi:MAG: hypothetical protein ACK41E_02175 [Deinococcales bacterium]